MSCVLIVDDEGELRTLLSRALADVDVEALTADRPELALAIAAERRPDLVVLDVDKPELDGWSLLARLRDLPKPPQIVALGGLDEFDAFAQGVEAGVFAFVPKPFAIDQLVATCTRAFQEVALPDLAPDGYERRHVPRRPLMVGVRIHPEIDKPMAVGELADLSSGGAQVILMVELEIGFRLEGALDLPHSGRALKFRAEVRWAKPTEAGFAHGLRFLDLSPDVQAQMRLLLGAD